MYRQESSGEREGGGRSVDVEEEGGRDRVEYCKNNYKQVRLRHYVKMAHKKHILYIRR